MIIEKKYHFYAAHRNKDAGEKCGRIHGHTYDIICSFKFGGQKDVEMLFSDIDAVVEPIIKQHCHWLLLHNADTLCSILKSANEPFLELNFPTSAENIAKYLFLLIQKTSLPIFKISLAETKSSTVVYEP